MRSGVSAGAVRDGGTGDGNGWGRGFPVGALAAAASECRTLHSTRPQKTGCGWDRPPDSYIATTAAQPPIRTSPAAAHTTG